MLLLHGKLHALISGPSTRILSHPCKDAWQDSPISHRRVAGLVTYTSGELPGEFLVLHTRNQMRSDAHPGTLSLAKLSHDSEPQSHQTLSVFMGNALNQPPVMHPWHWSLFSVLGFTAHSESRIELLRHICEWPFTWMCHPISSNFARQPSRDFMVSMSTSRPTCTGIHSHTKHVHWSSSAMPCAFQMISVRADFTATYHGLKPLLNY